jgi:hypothetical protein
MNQCGGLQRLTAIFVGHAMRCKVFQLVVQQRQQLCRGVWIAVFDRGGGHA